MGSNWVQRATAIGCAITFSAIASSAHAIIGGEKASGFAPNLLMILSDHGTMCSGVVIAPDAILTAAHCVTKGRSYRIHWKDAQGKPVLLEPGTITVHPQFNPDAVAARKPSVDLAIVRTRAPLPSHFHATPLAEAKTPVPDPGTTLNVVGFGLTVEWDPASAGKLQSVAIPIVVPYGPGRILIWLSGRSGTGACQGDSGGLIADNTGIAIAITAWSEGTASRRCGALTQGVLIAPQRAWIGKVLER